MKFHELSSIFPLLEGPEFNSLVESIKKYGLAQEIVTYEGKILDGRNRFRACEKAGVEPRFFAYEGDDPISFLISVNCIRQHDSESQRAMQRV